MLSHSSEPLHKLCLSLDNLCFLLSLSFKTQAQVTSLLESLLLFFTLILKPLLGCFLSAALYNIAFTPRNRWLLPSIPSPNQLICRLHLSLQHLAQPFTTVYAGQVFTGFTSSLHLPGSSISSRPLLGNIAF